MSASWDYAELTKTASVMGGPEVYVAAIKRAAFLRGMSRGMLVGSLFGVGATTVMALGIERYRRIQAEATEAEIALLDAMNDPNGG